jgi:hypothetical protein
MRTARFESVAKRELHSSIGAGLVAGIAEHAAELPSLVAEHHRRLIAFDHVPDVMRPMQRRTSRLLATTVRFLEIVDGLATNSVAELPQLALYPAAIQLSREANQGEWDPIVAGEVLHALGFQLKYEPAGFGNEFNWAQDSRRLDPAVAGVPDPNFLSTHEVRDARYVRSTRR